ncbi:M50 family metallopeptidase [Arthrobacter sp. USHLN218]|uniref:M50 family metallopeptidase n=1 Tax=Arthrobacter sp. USHLN218 TaxID=3081232 RepID=UPI00301661BE
MTVLLFVLGVLFVAVGIAVSIALHEVGHLVPAKLFGVRVTQYMVGFGKTLFSRRKGETEYGLKAVPAGGYVSMIGMYPPAKGGDGRVRKSSTGLFQQLAEDARTADAERLQPGDENRLFYKLPVYKRIIIMLGGPFMNLLIGVVLLGIVMVGFGTAQPSTTIAQVNKCVVPASQQAETGQTDCLPSDPEAPATAAGIRPGDTVTEFDGKPVTDWYELTRWIRDAAGQQTPIVLERGGQTIRTTITPILTERPVLGEDNQPVLDASGDPVVEQAGFVGMGSTTELTPQPATEVLPAVGENLQAITGVVLHLPQRLADVAEAAFSDAPRDPNGPMSVVGVGRIAGEITAMDEIPMEARAASLIGLVGSVNLALFVFNLIPLLPLDGGHIAGALWEAVRRGVARLFRRPDPGPVDIARLLPLTYAVAIVMLGMGALLIYADIVKPVNIFG